MLDKLNKKIVSLVDNADAKTQMYYKWYIKLQVWYMIGAVVFIIVYLINKVVG